MAIQFPAPTESPFVYEHAGVTTIYEWQDGHGEQYWKATVRDHTLDELDARYVNLQQSLAVSANDRPLQKEIKTGSIQATIGFSGGYEIQNQPELP